MRRVPSAPRENWEQTVKAHGLGWPMTEMPDGSSRPYWNESAKYEFSEAEVDAIEEATRALHIMALEVVPDLYSGKYGDLGLPAGALELAKASFEKDRDKIVYGRFDLVVNSPEGNGQYTDIKMLEYNADTPTGLVETAVAQWQWLQDTNPELDQFNSVFDRLVERWKKLKSSLPSRMLHLATTDGDGTAEEWMTVEVMAETARQAGIDVKVVLMEDIHWVESHGIFVDPDDCILESVFKLYPWELMLHEEYGKHIMADPEQIRWLEPLWKVLLSSKMMGVAMWDRFGMDPDRAKYLLPSYHDEIEASTRLGDWVKKPLHGREGDNISIHAPFAGVEDIEAKDGGYGEEGYIWQAYTPLPVFSDDTGAEHHLVIGSWIIGSNPAGMLCRESDGLITDYYSRVVPHVITDMAAPSEEQRKQWLLEDAL